MYVYLQSCLQQIVTAMLYCNWINRTNPTYDDCNKNTWWQFIFESNRYSYLIMRRMQTQLIHLMSSNLHIAHIGFQWQSTPILLLVQNSKYLTHFVLIYKYYWLYFTEIKIYGDSYKEKIATILGVFVKELWL